MRIRSLALLTTAAVLATTTACVPTSEETRPAPRPSVSEEEVTPVETPDDAPKVSIVDSSPGGAKDADPLWQGLAATQLRYALILLDLPAMLWFAGRLWLARKHRWYVQRENDGDRRAAARALRR